MAEKGGTPTQESGTVRAPLLPVFSEADLPSAAQIGLQAVVEDSNGKIWFSVADGTDWRKLVEIA